MYKQLINLAFYSRGSLTFIDAYNLPIALRQLYISQINNFVSEENKAAEKAAKRART